ncbi:DUF1700 domain-containing protein [Ihubacter sp. rT4E-8]|uniref:DUF1700 domain-containing protein n=1 Tax=unclassified Ihubacter TaxID=2633299 RepID=UPI00137948E5
MTKETFLHQLRIRLTPLPESEIKKRLDYYSELIDDMLEDGISEAEAIASFGSVDQIAQSILYQTSSFNLKTEKSNKKSGWTVTAIILAVIGSPLWLPLLLAFGIVALSMIIVVFALIICILAVVFSLGIVGVLLVIRAFSLLITEGVCYAMLTIGSGLLLTGCCLLAFLGAKAAVPWLVQLCSQLFNKSKNLFHRKEEI